MTELTTTQIADRRDVTVAAASTTGRVLMRLMAKRETRGTNRKW